MAGDLRDKAAYGFAIVALGAALAALLIGICWVASQQADTTETLTHMCPLGESVHCRPLVYVHTATGVSEKLWYALAALAGVFVGVLVPFAPPKSSSSDSSFLAIGGFEASFDVVYFIATLLALGFGVMVAIVVANDSLPALALVGLLLGFLIPSPARGD